jgi:GAF domain-containing protein
MSDAVLEERYRRIYEQLKDLLKKTDDKIAKMATIAALLHHKMSHFFWTGFYRIVNDELTVGPYQGPLACQVLEKNKGVCWTCINRRESIVVPDVEKFPGHIPCDPRSKSEITIPLWEGDEVYGVLDVDSDKLNAFSEIDRKWLEKIIELI